MLPDVSIADGAGDAIVVVESVVTVVVESVVDVVLSDALLQAVIAPAIAHTAINRFIVFGLNFR